MPQKLIRLTCESNDGVFDGLFDQDIRIKQDSEIAFQSLTMEQTPGSLTIRNTNDTITFQSRDVPGSDQTCNMVNGTYTDKDKVALMKNIENSMNSVCDFTAQPSQMNSQWDASINELEDDKVEIQVKPSPFFPLACWNPLDAIPVFNTQTVRDASTQAGVTGAEVPIIGVGGMTRLTQTAAGNLNECYLFSEHPFIKSTGSWRIRLAAMTQGTANRPAFTLGMTDAAGLAKLQNATITNEDLVYAIQVAERSNDPAQGGFSYINQKGSATATQSNPFLKIEQAQLATKSSNDVLEIVLKNGQLQGQVTQLTAGTTTLPASAVTNYNEVDLYPVICFHLASLPPTPGPIVNNNIDMIQCSLDPWYTYIGVNPDPLWQAILEENPQLEPLVDDLATVKYDPPVGVSTTRFFTSVVFETLAVANFLGYTNQILATADTATGVMKGVGASLFFPPKVTLRNPNTGRFYSQNQGYSLISKEVQPFAVDAQSYLIDTQTFLLDSYDSFGLSVKDRAANAGGSRRNLLSTIPSQTQAAITGSTNTRVVYEPNTLEYIAIKNRSDIITRQIRMRLLDARYGPVATVGLAAMTVLIKEPYTE